MKTNRPAFRIGCLIVASMMLGGIPATVRAQEPAGASTNAAVISSVAITQAPQRAAIRVEGAGKLDVHAAHRSRNAGHRRFLSREPRAAEVEH